MHLCSEQLVIIGRENRYLFLLYWLSDTYDDDNVKVIIEKWKNREGIEGNVCTFLKSLLTYYMWECQDPLKEMCCHTCNFNINETFGWCTYNYKACEIYIHDIHLFVKDLRLPVPWQIAFLSLGFFKRITENFFLFFFYFELSIFWLLNRCCGERLASRCHLGVKLLKNKMLIFNLFLSSFSLWHH